MNYVKNFLKKLNNMPPAAKASFWFVVSNVVLRGISFITTPIFTRLLDVSDYGISSVFITWEGIISIFATLSLAGGVYNVAMTKFEDDIDTVTSSLIGLTAVSSTLVYLCCITVNFLFPNLFELSTGYLIFMWVQTFFNATTTFWLMRKRFTYDYKKVIAYTFSNALLSPVVAIIAVKLVSENKAYAKVIGSGIWGILVGAAIMVLLIFKGKKLYHKEYWRYALKFNLPLIPHYLSQTVLTSADKLMLNAIVGSASAGLYSISHSITGTVSIITTSINHSLIPYVLQSIKAKKFGDLKKIIIICTLLVSVVCIGLMLFAKEGILIFATKEYLDAVWFIPPLTMSVLFLFVVGIIGNILFYYEKTWQMSAITIAAAVLNIISNYLGIKLFGFVAPAYTTVLCSFVQLILYYFIVKRYQKNLDEILDIKLFLFIMAVYVGFMIYSIVFYNNLFARIALMLLVLVAVIIFHKKIINMFKSMSTSKQ